MAEKDDNLVAIVYKEDGQRFKELASECSCLDTNRLLNKEGENVLVPVKKEILKKRDSFNGIEFHVESTTLRGKQGTLRNQLVTKLTELVHENRLCPTILEQIPKHWEHLEDVVLFPMNSFQSKDWEKINIWNVIKEIFEVSRVGVHSEIQPDLFRSPKVQLMVGSDPWVTRRENGIVYTYDVTKSMFSSGNITEKQRLSEIDCSNDVIVDLYAGIGYFTLTYLKHCYAKHVYACEVNPAAIEALRKNLVLNGVAERCTVLEGNNNDVCPRRVASRVNLGLIPSSERGWPVACRAIDLNRGRCVLHVHQCIQSGKDEERMQWKKTTIESPCSKWSKKALANQSWIEFAEDARSRIKEMMQTEQDVACSVHIDNIVHVKSYGLRLDHIVVDLCVNKS